MPTSLCLKSRGEQEFCMLPEHHGGDCTYTHRLPGVTEEQIALTKAFDKTAFAFMEEHGMCVHTFLNYLLGQVAGAAVRSGESSPAFLARAAEMYSEVSHLAGQKPRLRVVTEETD